MITPENSFQVDESNVRQLVDAAEASIFHFLVSFYFHFLGKFFSLLLSMLVFTLSLSTQVFSTFTFYASLFPFHCLGLFHFHFTCKIFSL